MPGGSRGFGFVTATAEANEQLGRVHAAGGSLLPEAMERSEGKGLPLPTGDREVRAVVIPLHWWSRCRVR